MIRKQPCVAIAKWVRVDYVRTTLPRTYVSSQTLNRSRCARRRGSLSGLFGVRVNLSYAVASLFSQADAQETELWALEPE